MLIKKGGLLIPSPISTMPQPPPPGNQLFSTVKIVVCLFIFFLNYTSEI